jgi:polyhydroxyalkanoate synthesis regulator phasin
MHPRIVPFALSACLFLSCGVAVAAAAEAGRADEEVRNTVVNLLQNLVDRGVLTREQAEKIVRDAQAKAATDAAAAAAQAEAEKDAVRVPYVPEIVKEEIRRQVQADVAAQVTKDVQQAAKDEGWGVPAALPDWVRRMRWYSDLRVRGEADLYASDNTDRFYLDVQRVNDAGGIGRAGADPYLNTSVDRERFRGRFRFGFDTQLGYGWSTGARIATGDLRNPISTNMTFGSGGGRYAIGLDLAWLDYTFISATVRHTASVTAGRMRNPFVAPTELVYDQDLNLDGLAASYRFGLQRDNHDSHYVFATVGAFALQEVELSTRDKWLLGGQLGVDWKFESRSRLRASAAYYDFANVAGRRNAFDSDLLDYTAPLYLSKGNTVLFDIRNDSDESTNLFALAADYQVINYALSFDKRVGEGHRVSLVGDYAQNIGYQVAQVRNRSGYLVPRRNVGYLGELSVGTVTMNRAGAWQAAVGYRHVQRDAVLDAFTDSDFRLGGTDAKGYYLRLDYGFTPMVAARVKYMSGTEIDGPPLGIDVLQLDVTASF